MVKAVQGDEVLFAIRPDANPKHPHETSGLNIKFHFGVGSVRQYGPPIRT
jgi:hypothetical protein